jgi:Fic family protein
MPHANLHPDIRIFETPQPTDQELAVVELIDEVRRSQAHWLREPRRWNGLVRKLLVARAVRGSNSIEGIRVSLEDAIAILEDEEPLDADQEATYAVRGYRDAMTYILGLADDPHFEFELGLIRSLHYMMLRHDLEKRPGKWRIGEIFVHDEESNEIVYEGPESDLVPGLMATLNQTLRQADGIPVLISAAMAHLNLAMIHPFKDGNGRMARALQTLVLSREGILAPEFSSLEEYLGTIQTPYFDILMEVGAGRYQPERDARPWVRFILTAHFRQAQILQRRVRNWERVWAALERTAAQRQLPERSTPSLWNAAFGARITNPTYREHADVSEYTAGRDLKALVTTGLLDAVGERRGRFYIASQALWAIRQEVQAPRAPLDDPFELVEQAHQASLL